MERISLLKEKWLKEEKSYKFIFSLSCHDHCLTEKEAEEQIVSYATLTEENKKKYYNEEEKLLNFYKNIFENYSIAITFHDEPADVYKVESCRQFLEICTESIREKKIINLYVKELNFLISGSYDLELLLFVDEPSVIDKLDAQNLLEGLHTIPVPALTEHSELLDPDTGQIICPVRGIHHGGSFWKLYDNITELKKGKRIGTISENGIWLRK